MEYRGFTIKIHYDNDAQSPREEFDNLGTMYTSHRRYQPEEDFNKHFDEEEVFDGQFGIFNKTFLRDYIALPIYLYDHSGQTVNTTGFSCRWDTSRFGIIAVSIADAKKEYGWKVITSKRRQKIESYLDGEIETYDDYLRGSVYGFSIEDEEENEVENVWGFYGDNSISDMEEECKATIDYILNKRLADKLKAKMDKIKKYGRQLFLPFTEFLEFDIELV